MPQPGPKAILQTKTERQTHPLPEAIVLPHRLIPQIIHPACPLGTSPRFPASAVHPLQTPVLSSDASFEALLQFPESFYDSFPHKTFQHDQ